jgi:uncharacterized protein
VRISLTPLHPGEGAGQLHFLDAPISFWGGTDLEGRIVDVRHPQFNLKLTGGVLVLPETRGSSSSSSILAEQIRLETAPGGIILTKRDPIILLGAIAAMELYCRSVPIALANSEQLILIRTASWLSLRVTEENATIELFHEGSH